MTIKPIHTEADYQQALIRLEEVFDARRGTPEGDELEILSILIDNFEKANFPMEKPDPVEAILFRLEQMGLEPKDLEDVLGYKSRVSEVLNRKRKLSLRMIRKLKEKLEIPTDILIQEY